MGTVRIAIAAAALAALAVGAGCQQPGAHFCADGTVCPSDKVCAPAGGTCVGADQVAACEGIGDGDTCNAPGIDGGRCRDRVCVSAGCGDDITDDDEVCDDGNTVSGDGCRADCQKREVCGDGELDEGEDCDDANDNPADACDACTLTRWTATPVLGADANRTSIGLDIPSSLALDTAGNVYVAETNGHRIHRIDAVSGVVTAIAGTGAPGSSGDGGPATAAELRLPGAVAVDGLGNVYIADTGNHAIRRVDAQTGLITTVAGELGSAATPGAVVEDVDATGARLLSPAGVAISGLGELYIADTGNHAVRRVDPGNGRIYTMAGDGTEGPLSSPRGVTAVGGDVYVADTGNGRILRIDDAGAITTVAGTTPGYGGDGGDATAAQLSSPYQVSVTSDGSIYIADSRNFRVRRVDPGGTIATIAGIGDKGFAGDGGPAVDATIDPTGIAVDASGAIYLADNDNLRVRRFTAGGTIETFAGNGAPGDSGEDGAATSTGVAVGGVAVDGAGNLFIADYLDHRIRRVDKATGVITTVAGIGTAGDSGDGGPATAAALDSPAGLAVDPAGNLYIADFGNHRVRRVLAVSGVIEAYAGTGTSGYTGDGGDATAATLGLPSDVALDPAGNLYIADYGADVVRRVDAITGVITTTAGTGTPGYSGDAGLATAAELRLPRGVATDSAGDLYIADSGNNVIRRVEMVGGTIKTIAGTGTAGDGPEGVPAITSMLSMPAYLAVGSGDVVFVSDNGNHRVRKIDGGMVKNVAGTGTPGARGDGGSATFARLYRPLGVAIDGGDRLYIADEVNNRIRVVDTGAGTIDSVAGGLAPPGMGPIAAARLADPRAIAVGGGQSFVAGGAHGVIERLRPSIGWLDAVAGRYPHELATGNLAPLRASDFGDVDGVAYDPDAGVVFLAETGGNRIHGVAIADPAEPATWTIQTLANLAGDAGFRDGQVLQALFRAPTGLYHDAAASVLYVADTGNHVVRAIDLGTATVSTVAGTPATRGWFGDGGDATAALLYEPHAITRCPDGDLFIADTGNHRVRRIDGDGVITTVLGVGVPASSGEGAPATTFPIDSPLGLACDALGNLYVTSRTTVRMVPADDGGVVDGSGPVLTIYGAAPRSFPATVTYCLTGIAVIDERTLHVTDACAGMLIELTRD